MKRPWSPYTKGHTVGLSFRGFPGAQFKIYHDKATKLLQIHSVLVRGFTTEGGFLLPYEIWERLRGTVQQVEFCGRADIVCFRISGEHFETYGQMMRVSRMGSESMDTGWVVPIRRFEKVEMVYDEPTLQLEL